MKNAFLWTVAILACHVSVACAQREKLKPLKGVSVRVTFTSNPYNPLAPSGDIIVTLTNRSKRPITGPVNYDGKKLRIQAGSLTLYRRKPAPGLPPVIRPGESAEIARLPMAEVFAGRIVPAKQAAERVYRWSWRRRPEPPASPIHVWRPKKDVKRFLPFAYLTARFRVGDEEAVSNAAVVVVNVFARPQALNGVFVQLKSKTTKYDPSATKNGALVCQVINKSGKAIHVPAEYDASGFKLRAHTAPLFRHVLTLYKKQKKGVKPATVIVKPGESHLLPAVQLDDILRIKNSGGPWRWDWSARPKAPLSPLSVGLRPGDSAVNEISLYATVRVNHTLVTTNVLRLPIQQSK